MQENDAPPATSWLNEALGDPTDRELIIIKERRLTEEGVTLETLGRKLGVSKERVETDRTPGPPQTPAR